MALITADRVKETSTTTGTGTLTLAGAVNGFKSFADIGNGNQCYYAIVGVAVPSEWEVGIGTYTASGTTLSRDTVLRSSTGSKVSFSAGAKEVFVTYPADKAVFKDDLGTIASQSASNIAITGGSVYADNSGLNTVTAAALHRSPNAVTAMFVYDTSKDSDGGAWTEKCQHTSWYNEPLNGKWLGAAASESVARAVSGATTGDYFQLTTDGKFYKLNATSGTTEVFRGNKADFPRLAGIVAEAGNVNIYDLTEPGRPMWMRVMSVLAASPYNQFWRGGRSATSVFALNGDLLFTSNVGYSDPAQGLQKVSFISDKLTRISSSLTDPNPPFIPGVFSGGVSDRNSTTLFARNATQTIANNQANAIAMTVLPDAPVDPVTGLQLPTIAVATAGGVSVIKHNGTVVNSSVTAAFADVEITPQFLYAGRASALLWYYATNPGALGASFTLSSRTESQAPDFARGIFLGSQLVNRSELLRRTSTNALLQKLKNFEADPAKSAAATITNTFNTGHQPGDIRRTYLSDVGAGSVGPAPELVTNGTFDTDTTGWTATNANQSVVSGELQIENSTASGGFSQQLFSTVSGKWYRVDYKARRGTAASLQVAARDVGGSTLSNVVISNAGDQVGSLYFLAISSTSLVRLLLNTPVSGATGFFDNISVVEVVPDRSYKAQGANITGTLTKTEVATAAQLVAYSGFSAANYLREPYSADLDFGTGEWSASAWVNIPTANAAAGVIAERSHSTGPRITLGITAANLLTATAFDGTTTRTVTTTAAYNTATWLKARANYTTDGTLAITVNGVQVAATYGAPLLTLNNSNAVLTIGNSYAADAPFPGSIALLKFSATVPTAEQAQWMYEQEKQLFRENAKCVLPDSGAIVDLSYDDATDKWIAVSAANESEWSGLVRTSVTAVPAGSYTKAYSTSGVQLLARSTTNPGVDVSIPAYGLREELVKRAEAAARLNANLVTFDYVGGFTANTTNGSTSIASVAGLTYPTSYIGATVTGSGIPASTVITAVSGTTIYLSKAATATATGVQISFTDFILPVGYETEVVSAAGATKVEGSTKDYTKLFDGFKETVRFGTAPGYNVAVQIQASRSEA